jgi:Ala-tRNA(Pro) deacylase
MSIAPRLKWYHSSSSRETAHQAHVPPERVAKPVLLEDERGYVMAIVPASHRVDLERLSEQLHRDLALAKEREIAALFHDCDRGAMPPVGGPYRVPTVYDDALAGCPEIYFEAGDHEDVVHLPGAEFLRLLEGSLHGRFSHRI